MTTRTLVVRRFRPLAIMLLCGLTGVSAVSAQVVLEGDDDTLTATPTGLARSAVGNFIHFPSQRGVRLDGGIMRSGAAPLRVAANPGASSWNSNGFLGDVDLGNGYFAPSDVDMALPAPGFSWVIGRSFNPTNNDSTPDANGPQGINWMQSSQVEIVFINNATDSKDTVRLIYGASAYTDYVRGSSTHNEFKGVNGAAGVFKFVAGAGGEPDTWTLTDPSGMQAVFFGAGATYTDAMSHAHDGSWQIWKYVDPAGNTAYVGDASTGSTAIKTGYDDLQRMLNAYDSADRRYTYTYSTVDSVIRLTRVKAETRTGGTWASPSGLATVGQVDYSHYHTGDNTFGNNGCLKDVSITTPLSDPSQTIVRTKHYRYVTGAYNSSTNPKADLIVLVVGFEGVRRYDLIPMADHGSDVTSGLVSYAEASLTYDTSRRVATVFYNGQCGCAGSPNGVYELTYGTNSSYMDNSGYDTAWMTRTIIKQPDATYVTQYFDEADQPISRVMTSSDPAGVGVIPTWARSVTRSGGGAVSVISSPANATGYTHSSGAIATSTSAGLLNGGSLIGGGDLINFQDGATVQSAGTSSSANYTSKDSISTRDFRVTSGGSVYVKRPQYDWHKSFHTADTGDSDASKYNRTDYSYTYWSTTNTDPLYLVPKVVTTTLPVVTTGTNGSNSASTTTSFLRKDGTVAFSIAADGIYNYRQYTNGQLTKTIADANVHTSADYASGDNPVSDFGATDVDAGLRITRTYTYDPQGRSDTVTAPDGLVSKMWYTKLSDGRMVTLSIPRFVAGTPTSYGPVSYSVTNYAGKVEYSGTIALGGGSSTTVLTSWITNSSDPIAAVNGSVGALARLQGKIYSDDGNRVLESRAYFLIPGTGAGSAGTNYDSNTYGYDDMGRQWREKDPTGTITRVVYDTAGRVIERWIGTNDHSFTGGESAGSDDMVKVAATEYDGGSAGGNSLVTKTTSFVENSTTDQRQTSYIYDARGRRVVTVSPQSPHTVVLYDNMDRVIATGQYSSSSGLTASTNPTTVTTDRTGLDESDYDSNDRIWKTIRHKIAQSSGADSDTIVDETWFDESSRTIKKKDQSGIHKFSYDRLGHLTRLAVLASDDDSIYTDAKSLTGDKVLEQTDIIMDTIKNVALVYASIERYHDDATSTGSLDNNNDGDGAMWTAADINGRLRIAAFYYDELHRCIDVVSYGTFGQTNGTGPAFVRPTNPDSRSDSALRTTNSFGMDGSVEATQDARGQITRYINDDMRRTICIIKNYCDGTPGGGTNNDQDHITRYEYSNGLLTRITADLFSNDQETIYTYGVTKGASVPDSKISSNRLLHTVQYPDSSGGSDVMTYAYNAQGQQIYIKDQLGTETSLTYDTAGRLLHKGLTSIAGSLDSSVARISTAFDSRGMVSTVTQYDNATPGSGSVVDQVKYTYDDWGNMTVFEQDRDSAVSGGGNQYSVAYAYTNHSGAGIAPALRRTSMTLPDGSTLAYEYATGIDDDLSRVTDIKLGSVVVASYSYLGDGQLAGTNLPEPNVSYNVYGPSSARDYARLDRFGRTISSRWDNTGGGNTPVYDVELAYDRNSNITLAEDKIQNNGGSLETFSAQYSMDDLNRLIRAEEGNWSGSVINNRTRDEQWTLSPTGNFDRRKIDLNGDGSFGGTDEIDDTSTFNKANEWLTRDTDSNNGTTGNNYTLTHDLDGQLTDDGKSYKYKYDGFGRLTEVTNQSNSLVAEYRYNGLGYRIGWHYDTSTPPNGVDGSDPWYYFAYDERWRPVATFRGSDTTPKEQFVFHAAGKGGMGGSSYIDSVVLRDKDANTTWTTASDGTLEERIYYCQNWRNDVSVIVKPDSGNGLEIVEWIKYSAYGVPFCIAAGDYDRSGGISAADHTAFDTDFNNSDPRADVNFDGTVDLNDFFAFYNAYGTGEGGGRNVASRASIKNRIGYAGYQWDSTVHDYHVRNRVLATELGRWIRRDPAENGFSLYQALDDMPLLQLDPTGLYGVRVQGRIHFIKGKSLKDWDWIAVYTFEAVSKDKPGWIVQKNDAAGCLYYSKGSMQGQVAFNLPEKMGAPFWEAWPVPSDNGFYGMQTGFDDPQDGIPMKVIAGKGQMHMQLGDKRPAPGAWFAKDTVHLGGLDATDLHGWLWFYGRSRFYSKEYLNTTHSVYPEKWTDHNDNSGVVASTNTEPDFWYNSDLPDDAIRDPYLGFHSDYMEAHARMTRPAHDDLSFPD